MFAIDDGADLEHALAQAVAACEQAHVLIATTHFHLESALTAIRDGRPEDALGYLAAVAECQKHCQVTQ